MTSLKDFIEQSLTEIVEGLEAFEKKTDKATANPTLSNDNPPVEVLKSAGLIYLGLTDENTPDLARNKKFRYATMLDFDVAVTVSAAKAGDVGAKASLQVVGVNIGGGASGTASHGNASEQRLKFRIPLELKITKDPGVAF
ncbi:hypothetical protein [Thalassospira sp. UBA4513]|uniref:hypothetical protein n=1 Tax=Thalassospira sp. UBA4513 TaxID=1947675 RepID=UPI00257A2AFB|nr:hypothetical protein [Thalassospira sp. UBA4513]